MSREEKNNLIEMGQCVTCLSANTLPMTAALPTWLTERLAHVMTLGTIFAFVACV